MGCVTALIPITPLFLTVEGVSRHAERFMVLATAVSRGKVAKGCTSMLRKRSMNNRDGQEKGTTFLEYLLYFAILTDMCFFYILPLPGMIASNVTLWAKFGVFAVVVLICFYLLIKKGRSIGNVQITPLGIILSILVLSSIIETIFTFVSYASIDLLAPIKQGCYYSIPILALGFLSAFKQRGDYRQLMNGISCLCLIFMVVYVGTAAIYNFTGKMLVPDLLYGGGKAEIVNYYRGSGVRLYAIASLLPISMLYAFIRIFWGKQLSFRSIVFFTLVLVLGAVSLVYVNQSRVGIIAVFAACFLPLIACKMGGSSSIKKLLICLVVAFVLIETGYVSTLLDSFFGSNAGGSYEGSSLARNYATMHYLSEFIKNPIFGFGFISGDSSFSNIVNGSAGIAYTSDVGFVGQMGNWGLLFVISYLLIVGRMVFIIAKSWKVQTPEHRAMMLSIIVYILATTPTLIMFDSARIMICPLALAVFEFLYSSSGDENVL